jgi:general secretion pathway protein J
MTGPHSSSHDGDGQSGVTLVEIVVALTVIALVLVLSATALRLLASSGERGARLAARHDSLSRGIDVLRRDVERMERVMRKNGESVEMVFHGDAERLVFVAIEPPFPSEPGPYFISYAIRQQSNGATIVRERAPFQDSAIDILRLPTEDSVAVIEGPYRARFLYLEVKEKGERWLPEWPHSDDLPSLIALEIGGVAEGAMRVVARPRADAERSCIKGGDTCSLTGKDKDDAGAPPAGGAK